ncbi:MAG: hypothetical protein BWX80_04219 [Candidatus Hydrogenedentes bacterium ADurb.Bin101]|nr:MAG: hypothetical protein BWX80_04219 [Candidatus Hydrogenedentes bacterium ADurb.Bin101]
MLGNFKGPHREIEHFLRIERRQNDGTVIAMTATPRRLVVIGLRGLDAAKPRSGTHNIGNQTGDLGTGKKRNAFLHQRNTGAGGTRHNTGTRGRSPQHHVNASQFTLSLQEGPPRFRKPPGQILRNLVLRGNGVAEITIQPGTHRAFSQGNISLY